MTNPNTDDPAIIDFGSALPEVLYILRELELMYRFGRYDRDEVTEHLEKLDTLGNHIAGGSAAEQCLRAAHDIWIATEVLQMTSYRVINDFGTGSARRVIKSLGTLANPRPKLVACLQRILELLLELRHLYVEYAVDDTSRQRQLAEEILALAEEFRQGVLPLCRGTEREQQVFRDCMGAFVNISVAAHVMGQHTTPVQLIRRARASVRAAEYACFPPLRELREREARGAP